MSAVLSACVVTGAGLAPTLRSPPALAGVEVAQGAKVWRSGPATVLVLDRAGGRQVLAGLRSARVRRLDLVVARQRGSFSLQALDPLLERVPVRALLGPPGLAVAGASVGRPGQVLRVGPLAVHVRSAGARLDVEVHTDAEGDTGAEPASHVGPGP